MIRVLSGIVAALFAISAFPGPGMGQQGSSDVNVESRYQEWMHVVYEDPFGEHSAEAAATGSITGGGDKLLSYLCYEDGNEAVMLKTSAFLGITMQDVETREVKWVVDGGQVHTYDWQLADTGFTGSTLALHAHISATALPVFLEEARSGSAIHLRISDHEGDTHDLQFSLQGFTSAYEAACEPS